MSTTQNRKETERTKLMQEKCQTLLTQMLRDEDNKYCVDCDAKGPRWASWNLGVFLCIRCAGIHRNLGVHISRVKSVNLDTWTPEQVISLQQMGNSRARAVYEAQLPDGFRRPQTDTALESFIRAKYEHKKYLAREWVPPSPPKVDWGKEIDEELERQKRKKKAAQAGNALGLGVISGSVGSEKKTTNATKTSPLPAPLPKPKANQSGGSPKTHRTSTSSAGGDSNQSNDLLGLSSPTKPVQSIVNVNASHDLHNDSFSNFLSASPASNADHNPDANINTQNSTQNSLAKEEEDFFNQGSLGNKIGDKDKSGKMTKDSILALYGTGATNAASTHNPQIPFGQSQQPMFAATGAYSGIGMAPSYMGVPGSAPYSQQQQQFMTPPNSVSMYNTPVMTAPNAFVTSGTGLNMHMGGATMSGGSFGGQFAMQNISGAGAAGYPQQMMPNAGGSSGGLLTTAQSTTTNINLMQTNQSLLSGMTLPQMTQQHMGNMGMQMPMSGNLPAMGSMPTTTAFQTSNAAATANLNQQFGNLNISNIWQ